MKRKIRDIYLIKQIFEMIFLDGLVYGSLSTEFLWFNFQYGSYLT